MKTAIQRRRTHTHARPYPNAADRSYFMGKLLDAVTSTVTGMGVITILFFLMTM